VTIAHVAFSTRQGFVEARACRLVVMPEWQGAGVGMRFLNAVCAAWRRGRNRYGRPMLTLFHTSHPGLAAALRRDPLWAQVSARLYGESKARSQATLKSSGRGAWQGTGFGGHFRAIQVQVRRGRLVIIEVSHTSCDLRKPLIRRHRQFRD
jgi:tRNA(Met) C34 N-acetyltransferase TmcA